MRKIQEVRIEEVRRAAERAIEKSGNDLDLADLLKAVATEVGLVNPTEPDIDAIEQKLKRCGTGLPELRTRATRRAANTGIFGPLSKAVVDRQLAALLPGRVSWADKDKVMHDLRLHGHEGFEDALRAFEPGGPKLSFEALADTLVRRAMVLREHEHWLSSHDAAPKACKRVREHIDRRLLQLARLFVEDECQAKPSLAEIADTLGVSTGTLADALSRSDRRASRWRVLFYEDELWTQAERFKQNLASDHGAQREDVMKRHRIYPVVPWISKEDAEQAGVEGWRDALRHFDGRRGKFEPYAYKCVHNAMVREANAGIPQGVLARVRAGKGSAEDLRIMAVLMPGPAPDYENQEWGTDTPDYDDQGWGTDISDYEDYDATGDWIDRGIHGPPKARFNEHKKEWIKKLLPTSPADGTACGLSEICYWLEGTWDYLARQTRSQRRPLAEDLAAALGVSLDTMQSALTKMDHILATSAGPL